MNSSNSPSGGALTTGLVLALFATMRISAEVNSVEIEGIPNFSQWQGAPSFAGQPVGFGGQPEPAAMAELAKRGFGTIITLRLPDEDNANIDALRSAAEGAGLHYLNLPFHPEKSPPGTIDSIISTMSEDANRPVFIHCNTATRAAVVWMAGRVQRDGLAPGVAKREGELIAEKPDLAVKFLDAWLDTAVSE